MGQHSGFSRADRVRKAMIREVSEIIAREIKNPILMDQLISVTDVEITNDLRHAKVFISVMASEEIQNQVMEALKEAQPQVRSLVGQRIRLRYTPEIHFHYDDSLVRGSRITTLLNQISRGELE